MDSYLFPLNHLLVKIIWEGPQRTELSRTFCTRKYAIFIDQPPTADGDQRDAVDAEAFVQVDISSLDLVVHRDGPEGRGEAERDRNHSG